jgi:hypothetical protein
MVGQQRARKVCLAQFASTHYLNYAP